MHLQLLCALYRFQPKMGLYSKLPAASPWVGSGAICCGRSRPHRQKRLCGTVHVALHKPPHRCSRKALPHLRKVSRFSHIAFGFLFFTFEMLCPLRISTCSPTERRWFQHVPGHALRPCKSELQRSSCQECGRTYGHGKRKKVKRIWTRWRDTILDIKSTSEDEALDRKGTTADIASPSSQPQVVHFCSSAAIYRKEEAVWKSRRGKMALRYTVKTRRLRLIKHPYSALMF